jgi:hypothetical protein
VVNLVDTLIDTALTFQLDSHVYGSGSQHVRDSLRSSRPHTPLLIFTTACALRPTTDSSLHSTLWWTLA